MRKDYKRLLIYKSAVKEASIELQKKADEQRAVQARSNAKRNAEARALAELENMVRLKLIESEWYRPFRVSMNFGFYVLSLKLSFDVECRYESSNKADVPARVGDLVNFANTPLFSQSREQRSNLTRQSSKSSRL